MSTEQQLQNGRLQNDLSLSSPSPERLRSWRLFFESAMAVTDVLDEELQREAGLVLEFGVEHVDQRERALEVQPPGAEPFGRRA